MAGWEPVEVTRYEYDENGLLVRSVTAREPEFSPTDVAVLLESRRHVVGPHGIPMDEALDPANQFAFEGTVVRDWAEAAKARKESEYKAQNPGADLSGVIVRVRRKSVSGGTR